EMREREACISKSRASAPKGNGICTDCLESVEVQRGNALRCISCQEDHELRLKQRTGGRRG
ncbi:hypothetical protein, partial [Shewanella sp. KCT]